MRDALLLIALFLLLPSRTYSQETTGSIMRLDAQTYRVRIDSYGPVEWREDPPLPACYYAVPYYRTGTLRISGPFGTPTNLTSGWSPSDDVVEWLDAYPQLPAGFDFVVVEGMTPIALSWTYWFEETDRVYQSDGPPCPPCSGGGDPCYSGGPWSIHASGGGVVYAVLPRTVGDSTLLRTTPVAIAGKTWGEVKGLYR
mgnify:CR=1 FL=1